MNDYTKSIERAIALVNEAQEMIPRDLMAQSDKEPPTLADNIYMDLSKVQTNLYRLKNEKVTP